MRGLTFNSTFTALENSSQFISAADSHTFKRKPRWGSMQVLARGKCEKLQLDHIRYSINQKSQTCMRKTFKQCCLRGYISAKMECISKSFTGMMPLPCTQSSDGQTWLCLASGEKHGLNFAAWSFWKWSRLCPLPHLCSDCVNTFWEYDVADCWEKPNIALSENADSTPLQILEARSFSYPTATTQHFRAT